MLRLNNQENAKYRHGHCKDETNTLGVFGARNKPTVH